MNHESNVENRRRSPRRVATKLRLRGRNRGQNLQRRELELMGPSKGFPTAMSDYRPAQGARRLKDDAGPAIQSSADVSLPLRPRLDVHSMNLCAPCAHFAVMETRNSESRTEER
jgi:hypothetical protein